MYRKKIEEKFQCPIEYAFSIFGPKWSCRIYCLLLRVRAFRFSDLRSHLKGISDPVLSSTLKKMIKSGLVERIEPNEAVPYARYAVTEKAKSAEPILQQLCEWSRDFSTPENSELLIQCGSCPNNQK